MAEKRLIKREKVQCNKEGDICRLDIEFKISLNLNPESWDSLEETAHIDGELVKLLKNTVKVFSKNRQHEIAYMQENVEGFDYRYKNIHEGDATKSNQ